MNIGEFTTINWREICNLGTQKEPLIKFMFQNWPVLTKVLRDNSKTKNIFINKFKR